MRMRWRWRWRKRKRTVTEEKEDLKMARPKRTVVWWNMRGVPVPPDFDARCIRPCLESACSKWLGSREVTIYALDDLTHPRVRVSDLEALSSSGILIRHVNVATREFEEDIESWVAKNKPSEAIMMLISTDFRFPKIEDKYKALGYTFIRPLFWTQKALLKEMAQHVSPHVDPYNHKDHESPWFCLLCKYSSPTHSHLMDHLKGPEHESKMIAFRSECKRRVIPPREVPKNKKLNAVVWWDINSCQVPNNYDLSCVRRSIESELYKSFPSLPYTIYAMGNLKGIPARTIKSISSSGILIRHTMRGSHDIMTSLIRWAVSHPPPVVVVLISNDESSSVELIHLKASALEASGYTLIRAYPGDAKSCKEWLWGNLIKETPEETNSQIVGDKCDNTDEPLYYCKWCKFPTSNYRSFANHLRDVEHANMEQFVESSSRFDISRRMKRHEEIRRAYANQNREHSVERIESSHQTEKKQEKGKEPTHLRGLQGGPLSWTWTQKAVLIEISKHVSAHHPPILYTYKRRGKTHFSEKPPKKRLLLS